MGGRLTSFRGAVVQWAIDQLEAGKIPAQIDIDEITNDPPPPFAVKAGLECLVAINDVVTERGAPFDTALVIPLPCESSELEMSPPSIAELVASEWEYGPGREVLGFYIVPPYVWGLVGDGEEYRRRLDDAEIPSGFLAYYRAWRKTYEIEENWEFNRVIYIRPVVESTSRLA